MLLILPFISALITAERSKATWLPVRELCSRDENSRMSAIPNYDIAELSHKATTPPMGAMHMEPVLIGGDRTFDNTEVFWSIAENPDQIIPAMSHVPEGVYSVRTYEDWITNKGEDGWL